LSFIFVFEGPEPRKEIILICDPVNRLIYVLSTPL
jgi:hypothetical protein